MLTVLNEVTRLVASKVSQELGDDAIIGVSCYNDIGLAIAAEKNSADYVAFGTMFSSPTKPDAVTAGPDTISQAKKQLSVPVCAIGGITEKNIHQLIQHDTDMAAVISSLSPDEFHHLSEGLGVLAKLPPLPGRQDALDLADAWF